MTAPTTEQWRKTAELYRDKAAECQTKAANTRDAWARRSFLESAEFWMRLGVQAARKMRAPVGGQGGQQEPRPPGEEPEI